MNDIKEHETHLKKLSNLHNERKRILALPSEKTLNAILDSPQALPLVHSFPEEDFYILINDIGESDSLPLLSLASNRQWEYILDNELWEKDRIDIKSITKWFDLLYSADTRRLINWIKDEKTELFELYFYKNIDVKVREHDEDPSVFGDDYFTFDDIYYIKLIDHPGRENTEDDSLELRNELIMKMMKFIAGNDHIFYQNILIESTSIIFSESEEEFYRLRNVRMAEKGFLPFDEAIGIYQPITPQEIEELGEKIIDEKFERDTLLPVPILPASMLKGDNSFTRALEMTDTDDVLQQIQIEFASLCNRIVSADQKKIKEKETLNTIVKKACGYINIGVRSFAGDEDAGNPVKVASMLKKYPLVNLFRAGYHSAMKLKWRVEKWMKTSWFMEKGLPLSFWDEKWMGVLGGLLIKKPLFFDNYTTGDLYREFESHDDIKKTEGILNEISEMDKLYSQISININPFYGSFLTYKNLILTLWVRNYMDLHDKTGPLSFDEFKSFFHSIFADPVGKRSLDHDKKSDKKTAVSDRHEIGRSGKESFLSWICTETGIPDYEISQKLGQIFENIFDEIVDEYGYLSEEELDPRFINLFLLERGEGEE